MTKKPTYEFEGFRLDPTKRRLFLNGRPSPLRPIAFNLLLVLVENHGRSLTKKEIIEKVWGLGSGDDRRLHVTLHEVRQKLGDSTRNPQFIARDTEGYRFIADVKEAVA